MEHENNKWPAARIIHLVGGCRAINQQGPIVKFDPPTLTGKQAQFQLDQYDSIYKNLESIGAGIVGVDFYSHVLEANGSMPPNWRSYHRTNETFWPTEKTAQTWGEIGHAGFTEKNGIIWDIASRICHQLRVSDWRLREISEAYFNQLFSKTRSKNFIVGQQYEDGFTWLSYLSIQSFLIDACILRDYLTEFMSEFLYSHLVESENYKIIAMGTFKKKILKKIKEPDTFTQDLIEATGKNGWLKRLGDYRDLVVHSAPLAQAERKLFSVCNEFKINNNGQSLPTIQCPIPESPAEISSSRSKGIHFEDFEKQFNIFIDAAKGVVPMIDGLDYASDVLGHLAKLSYKIAEQSPVKPKMMVFDKTNN